MRTKRDALERLLHESHWQTRAAHEVVAQELIDVWVFCNVYPIGINSVTRRLERLAKSFKTLNAYPKSRRKGDNYKQLLANFLANTGNWQFADTFAQMIYSKES